MKFIFKIILQYYLKYIAKLVLFIHRPLIIVIAGSANKSFVREQVGEILQKKGYNVRVSEKNFNTEIGAPLAILNLPSGYNLYKKWIIIIFKAFISIFQANFPKILVLELGVSKPGDMRYLISIVKPKVAIITQITQRYLENFKKIGETTKEFAKLTNNVLKGGIVILNNDNSEIRKLKNNLKTKIITYGKEKNSDWRILKIERKSRGECAKIKHNDIIEEININRFGEHNIYAKLAAKIVLENVKKIL